MFHWLKQLVREEYEQWLRLVDVRALERLSDHQLDDIGLRRDQLYALYARPRAEARPSFLGPVFRAEFEPCG
jgi:uncharacterized protein YjiS (DUF1127 family)